MADDLIGSGKLQGLTRAEIFSLLSEPPKTDYFKEYDLVYDLGPERSSISIDSEWLVVKFGQDGRVAKAAIVRGLKAFPGLTCRMRWPFAGNTRAQTGVQSLDTR